MQAQQFIRTWQAGSPAHALNERAGAQAHFIDLCRVLGAPELAGPGTCNVSHMCYIDFVPGP